MKFIRDTLLLHPGSYVETDYEALRQSRTCRLKFIDKRFISGLFCRRYRWVLNKIVMTEMPVKLYECLTHGINNERYGGQEMAIKPPDSRFYISSSTSRTDEEPEYYLNIEIYSLPVVYSGMWNSVV